MAKKFKPGDRMVMLVGKASRGDHGVAPDIYFVTKVGGVKEPFDYVEEGGDIKSGEMVVLEFVRYLDLDMRERRLWKLVEEGSK